MKKLGFALALTITACASEASTPRIRVARDLGCTANQVEIRRLDGNRWEVTGCDRTAIYLCTYPVRDCWREGEIRAVSRQPSSAQ
jgi:hypothetical protein